MLDFFMLTRNTVVVLYSLPIVQMQSPLLSKIIFDFLPWLIPHMHPSFMRVEVLSLT